MDIEDGIGDVVMSTAEARESGIAVPRPPKEMTSVRPLCIWMERRKKRVADARESLRRKVEFEDEDEHEEDEDESDAPITPSTFILSNCEVSRGRKRRHEDN